MLRQDPESAVVAALPVGDFCLSLIRHLEFGRLPAKFPGTSLESCSSRSLALFFHNLVVALTVTHVAPLFFNNLVVAFTVTLCSTRRPN